MRFTHDTDNKGKSFYYGEVIGDMAVSFSQIGSSKGTTF